MMDKKVFKYYWANNPIMAIERFLESWEWSRWWRKLNRRKKHEFRWK